MAHFILSSQELKEQIGQNVISADTPIEDGLIQPASIDLRFGKTAWRVAASFLPGGQKMSVEDKVAPLKMHDVDLTNGGILEKGCVYIVPLQEELDLPKHLKGRANPKSSTGRLDVFARILTDGADSFDNIPAGFKGRLYAEIAPRTFSIRARTGDRMTQLRLMKEDHTQNNISKPHMMPFTVDVDGTSKGAISGTTEFPPIIGWRARKHAGLVDLSHIKHYPVLDFWEPVFARKDGGVILDPDDFYILATKETVSIPYDYAAEMLAYDTSFGEFRVHYAGFFDPGFGMETAGGKGAKGVLEVRTHEVPFLIDRDQIVGRLSFEPMSQIPEKIYGTALGSNYQGQGLHLAKQFAAL